MKEQDLKQTLEVVSEAERKIEPVVLSSLLDTVANHIRRYVALKPEQSDACALWVAHTHVFAAAEATPYLEITSPEKQSGKTRLLETLEFIVARPWLTGRVTPAVLYRKIEKETPTLLLDESDAAFKGNPEYSEALRGILNSGYRIGGKVSVCVGQGKSINYQDFSCFNPKAIAGINKLPDTVSSRSITIVMRRRAAGEKVERLRRKQAEESAKPIRESLVQWANLHTKKLQGADPRIPDELDDRAADCWEPLLAIADLAGGEWPDRARKAALTLSGRAVEEDESIGVRLLADIKVVFGEQEKLFSEELCHSLIALEESPWGELPFGVRRGKEIDPRTLARFLKPYEIRPKQIKKDDIGKKGYLLVDFIDVWTRYIPDVSGEGNKGNERNPEALTNANNQQVSVVSDISPVKEVGNSSAYSKFPLYGKEHTCEYQVIENSHRCKHCGEFKNPKAAV